MPSSSLISLPSPHDAATVPPGGRCPAKSPSTSVNRGAPKTCLGERTVCSSPLPSAQSTKWGPAGSVGYAENVSTTNFLGPEASAENINCLREAQEKEACATHAPSQRAQLGGILKVSLFYCPCECVCCLCASVRVGIPRGFGGKDGFSRIKLRGGGGELKCSWRARCLDHQDCVPYIKGKAKKKGNKEEKGNKQSVCLGIPASDVYVLNGG